MSRGNTRRVKLRGRRGCLIWLPFLLFALITGSAGIVYGERAAITWEELTGKVATPTPVPAPDYAAIVRGFRRAEQAALATTLNANNAEVLAALPVFAVGDALELMTPQGNHRFQLDHLEGRDGKAALIAPGSGHRVKIPRPPQCDAGEYALLIRNLVA